MHGAAAALRLHRPGYHSEPALRSELQLMTALKQGGLAVPEPIATREGDFLVEAVDGQFADLIGWVHDSQIGESGTPLERSRVEIVAIYHGVGVAMADMHGIADAWAAPEGFARSAWNAEGLLGDAPLWGRGNYFTVAERSPFKHLIYPVPHAAGLGIHATLDLGKRVRFGPDVEWIDRIDYSVNAARAPMFYDAIRRYWPRLADGALTPDYTGIRPKLHGPGEPQPDFRIESAAEHGLPGLVNLLGIESPGLTSSMAIGDYAASFA